MKHLELSKYHVTKTGRICFEQPRILVNGNTVKVWVYESLNYLIRNGK